jgi:hypothetical protein
LTHPNPPRLPPATVPISRAEAEGFGLAAVHPRLGDARALFARADPDGVFANAHLERLGLVALGG